MAFSMKLAARCLECSSLGMRGDPMGLFRVSSSSRQFHESDCLSDLTHDSPRPSLNTSELSVRENAISIALPNENVGPPKEQTVRDSAISIALPIENENAGTATNEQQQGNNDTAQHTQSHCHQLASNCYQVANDPMLFPRIALMVMLMMLVAILMTIAWYVAVNHMHKSVSPFATNLGKDLAVTVKNELKRQVHDLGVIYIGVSISAVVVGCCLVITLTKGVSLSMRVEQSYIAQVKATKLAEKRSNHKTLFFANMSHDLRTPLAAIIGLIDLCLSHKEHISRELEANMVQMKNCATTLLGILNSILDMSKAEVGKLELKVTDFDLVQVLEEAVNFFAVVGSKKGVEVVLELPDDSIENVRWVRGDPERVMQLLCDLLSNGVKFTNQGYVILRAYPKQVSQSWVASASRRSGRWFHQTFRCNLFGCQRSNSLQLTSSRCPNSQSTDTLEFEFEVEDTGVGIPQSRREAVFRNFVQGSSKVHCTYGGTGIGLAIVRSLVHMMGGQIKVGNKETPGALFKFNLLFQKPLKDSKDSQCLKEIPRTSSQCWPLSGTLNQSFGEESQLLENAAPVGGLIVQGMKVVVAMEGDLGRRFISGWMQKKGAQVFEVLQLHNVLPTLERVITDRTSICSESSIDIESNGRHLNGSHCLAMLDSGLIPEGNELYATNFRTELDNLLGKSKTSCVHVCWIFSDASNRIWQTLHSRCDLTIQKPVHGSRLITLFEELQARHFQHVLSDQAQLLKGNSARKSDSEARRKSTSNANGLSSRNLTEDNNNNNKPRLSMSDRTELMDSITKEGESSGSSKVESFKGGVIGPLSELRILVVEDTPLLQKVTRMMLQREGAFIQVASNGEEAVNAVAATFNSQDSVECVSAFDLILMDCQMPVMDGYSATLRIREIEGEEQHIPIVALTAHAMASDEDKCREVGMDAYLTKPLKLDALKTTIQYLNIARIS